ncbi:putative carbonic anhydrase [Magnetofaba australis IT-1]|uniref:Carbonic anhydrase n=2 Tax=Magnetofaba TaxID=1472292 RepID=A0A1Y2K6E2_9PROT|nr:putative carbonic anhydrase [Magnetofaba australis IT-1]
MDRVFRNNQEWAQRMSEDYRDVFRTLEQGQTPNYMWIGCSDSRVPANQITGLQQGEIFVHRNVANVVNHSDLNLLSALQFAVEVLKVPNILVVGHFGCGGVKAVLEGNRHGLVDNWLQHVRDVYGFHKQFIDDAIDPKERWRRLCKLNVVHQVTNVARTTIVQDAWERGQKVSVHGLVYGLHDGLLRDLEATHSCLEDLGRAGPHALDLMLRQPQESC